MIWLEDAVLVHTIIIHKHIITKTHKEYGKTFHVPLTPSQAGRQTGRQADRQANIPISAFLSAGESLTPSPVTATI